MALTCTQAWLIWSVSTIIHSITVVVERHTTTVVTGEFWPATRGRGGRNQHDDQDGDHQKHHPHPPGLEKSVSVSVSGAVNSIYVKCLKPHSVCFFKKNSCYPQSACSCHQHIIQQTHILMQQTWHTWTSTCFDTISRCHLQGIITTKLYHLTCQYIRYVRSYKPNQNVILLKYITLLYNIKLILKIIYSIMI